MVGQRAVDLALGRGKLYLSHGRIIKGNMKTRTPGKKVNKAWLHDHINDPYVKQAQRDGFRARAAYKLKEIDESFGLIKPGQVVLDLGSDIERHVKAGIAVKVDRTEHHMHHKFAVVDGKSVVTGSYNWTKSAAEFNQEK